MESFKKLQKDEETAKIAFLKPSLDSIIKDYSPFIEYLARKTFMEKNSSILSIEDLISAGKIALIEAYRRFDFSRGKSFRNFALLRVKGAMIDELRKCGVYTRSVWERSKQLERCIRDLRNYLGKDPSIEEIANELELSLDEFYNFIEKCAPILYVYPGDAGRKVNGDGSEDEDTTELFVAPAECDPFEIYAKAEETRKLYQAIDCLSEVERKVIKLHFFDDLHLTEIGKILDRTQGRVSQILKEALKKMKTFLESSDGKDLSRKVKKIKIKKISKNWYS